MGDWSSRVVNNVALCLLLPVMNVLNAWQGCPSQAVPHRGVSSTIPGWQHSGNDVGASNAHQTMPSFCDGCLLDARFVACRVCHHAAIACLLLIQVCPCQTLQPYGILMHLVYLIYPYMRTLPSWGCCKAPWRHPAALLETEVLRSVDRGPRG